MRKIIVLFLASISLPAFATMQDVTSMVQSRIAPGDYIGHSPKGRLCTVIAYEPAGFTIQEFKGTKQTKKTQLDLHAPKTTLESFKEYENSAVKFKIEIKDSRETGTILSRFKTAIVTPDMGNGPSMSVRSCTRGACFLPLGVLIDILTGQGGGLYDVEDYAHTVTCNDLQKI